MQMSKKIQAARGFTLIELMIVVAIIGILAAIAIPNFMKYQLRSRRTEGSINVAAIRTAQLSYFGSKDQFVTAAANPAAAGPDGALPGEGRKVPWQYNQPGWSDLGFEPEGDVYYVYETTRAPVGSSFVAAAVADLDQDGTNYSCWVFAKPVIDEDGNATAAEAESLLPDLCELGEEMVDDTPTPIPLQANKVYLASGEEHF